MCSAGRIYAAAATLAVGWTLAACGGAKPEPGPRGPGAPGSLPPVAPIASAAEGPASDPLASKESRAVARTLKRVSELRGLRATKPVPGVKLKREDLIGQVKAKALREFPAEALEREGKVLQLFGFAPPSFDYLEEMMTLLEAQLEGFYEPGNGTMYLAADLKGAEAQATLAHELVHALQDQTWDLRSRSTYRPGKGDETLALACLAEGDATSLMMDYVLAEKGQTAIELPEEVVKALMANGINEASTRGVPHIMRTTLVAPYIDGLAFVHAMRRQGGWAKVDRVWQAPPTTTEQVLHPEKWESHEAALTIPPPTANALGAGWKMVDEDTFGELGFALTFGEWLETTDARIAAAGWGGDRATVHSRGDEIAFAVHVRYDDSKTAAKDAFASRAYTKLADGLRRSLGGKPALDTNGTICWARPSLGPLLVARQGKDLILLGGPARRAATRDWSSTSTCAQVKPWADEILAMKP
jgi:hypothetical protein